MCFIMNVIFFIAKQNFHPILFTYPFQSLAIVMQNSYVLKQKFKPKYA